jgi:hypothetical protein
MAVSCDRQIACFGSRHCQKSVDECEGRYKSENVLVVPKPGSRAA